MNRPKMLYVYFFLLAVSVVVIVFICTTFQTEQIRLNSGEVINFNTGWHFKSSSGTSMSITLPVHSEPGAEKNKINSITNRLPAHLGSGMTLSFSTYHSRVSVYVEKKLIYQFGFNNHVQFGKSPACTAWHIIDLPEGSQGRQIAIEITSPYTKYASTFNGITIGTKSENITYLVRHFLISTIICGLVFIFGMALFFGYFIARKRLKNNLSLLYQSLFAICISISALTETSILQLMTGNVLVLGNIMYFSLMLCPIPFLLFFKTEYVKHRTELFDWLCIGAAANFLVCTFLQIANILDFSETVISTHIIIVSCLILSAYTTLENLLKYKDRTAMPFLVGILSMFIFYMVDMVRYYTGIYQDGALYSRAGLLVFIVIPSINTISRHFSMVELGMEARVLERLAYFDVLTQKKNRTAFELEIELLNGGADCVHVAIVSFDVNNLKSVNDNFGHRSGDELLMAVADVIQKSFEGYGNCYRVGGDEFVVIIRNYKAERTEACFDNFKKLLNDYNQKNPNRIEIAYGYAEYKLDDSNLFETMNRADILMYNNKKLMKDTSIQ
nr:diguanylate cyclase [uncultured Caproiciproducens sp.]